MPKPILVVDRSDLLKISAYRGHAPLLDGKIGALSVDGITISYSVEEGILPTSIQMNELLVGVEAISSRFPEPWLLPASVYLSRDAGTYFTAYVATQAEDSRTPPIDFAEEAIAGLADYVFQSNGVLTIHIFVGTDHDHKSFHFDVNPSLLRPTSPNGGADVL